MNDMRERGRAKPGNRKLSDTDVRAMRSARKRGMPVKEIAAMFGVSKSTASKVCSGAAYSHITV
jgi:transposase